MDYLREQLVRRLENAARALRREFISEGEDSSAFVESVIVEETADGARVHFFAPKPETTKTKSKGSKPSKSTDVEADDFEDTVA